MKYLDEYRDGRTAKAIAAAIGRTARRDWALMEVCGGPTHPHPPGCFSATASTRPAPAKGMAAWQAKSQGLTTSSPLVSQVLVPPMLSAILQSPGTRVQAFLGPGHVCTVMGRGEYEPIAARY